MSLVLLLTIRFHDGRYHGAPEWPPAPARLFQALIAAAAHGESLPDAAWKALAWLETQGAPVIAAPFARAANGFVNYVPNNDLDAVGGDVRRVGEIRAGKMIRARLFDAETPLVYAWTLDEADAGSHAETIIAIAEGLYQLGRGVDMAWAIGEIIAADDMTARLAAHRGTIHRPSRNGSGMPLACPQRGSLASLEARHAANKDRFRVQTAPAATKKDPHRTKVTGQLFSQPPKPRFAQIAYDCPPTYLLFDLSGADAPWPFTQLSGLVELVRDGAAKRLSDALPDKKDCIERVFIGGKDSTEADKAARLRIIPLPSIGHQHADRAIRRVLVEIPANCPLPKADIDWTFSGLDLSDIDPETGEVERERPTLIAADSRSMLKFYGADGERRSRLWRTVTPAALPDSARRRRIDPARRTEEAKGGAERRSELERAASSVHTALRHAGISEAIEAVRVQREPFEARGARVEDFAAGTRFSKHQLWHIELAFAEPVSGPLVIGDGRYLGLGLMAPADASPQKSFEFTISGPKPLLASDRVDFLRAVRRALMAIDSDHEGGGRVSRLFSGHEDDGAPARSGVHEHVFLATRGDGDRISALMVFAPDTVDRNSVLSLNEVRRFSDVVRRLSFVRAGHLGLIQLSRRERSDDLPPDLAPSREWVSEIPYVPTRHAKPKNDLELHVKSDILVECRRRGFPGPEIQVLSIETTSQSNIQAIVRLRFNRPVNGPILIGQGSHLGWGLFRSAEK